MSLTPAATEERQLDWLPDSSIAVVHVDFDAIRATSWYPSMARRLSPTTRQSLARVHHLRLALEHGPDQFWMTVVVHAEPGPSPTSWLDAGKPARTADFQGRKVTSTASVACFETPERLWVCTDHALLKQVLVPPEKRGARLSREPWTGAPKDTDYYVVAQARLTEAARTRAMRTLARKGDGAMAAVFGPVVHSLEAVSFRVADVAGDLAAVVEAHFDDETIAQRTVGMLTIMKAALLSRRDRAFGAQARQLLESLELRASGAEVVVELRVAGDAARAWADELANPRAPDDEQHDEEEQEDDDGETHGPEDFDDQASPQDSSVNEEA